MLEDKDEGASKESRLSEELKAKGRNEMLQKHLVINTISDIPTEIIIK